ncbi:Periplasmic thiol:disulfide interchange protein DsbA [Lysobacter dokdonensis DS-58]|uniref:Thiol:disulfide interchange protein DsbA n=1 Tax=Lysobacter dokdonensis DS-58 TaxID=1300345 RepID=A0A0A2WD11_9GAMM|nr:thiol:disulfide interchange protein DsbA/DsbL [Lysobacter dokdonensis]KGQ18051.1 Periplasmic thiol:disulfide interchange protein DsbA [Lysobacter dokdonensis DS-58]
MIRRAAFLLLALSLSALPVAAFAQSKNPVFENVDYEVLDNPGTFDKVGKGEIEVAEVFAYTCHHCHDLAPKLEAWRAKLPKNVKVRYLPAGYDLDDTFSRGFFASQQIGALGKTHAATFRALHDERVLPRNPSDAELTAYYATLGVDAKKFAAALTGPKVAQRMKAAREFSLRIGLEGTPTLIVDGKYRVLGRSLDDQLRIAGALIANPPR